MSSPHQIDPGKTPENLARLERLVATAPGIAIDTRAALADAVASVKESTARRLKILSLIQESMQQFRLDTKYLMFDLEATRRERDEALGATNDR
jgi:hypothetical protein